MEQLGAWSVLREPMPFVDPTPLFDGSEAARERSSGSCTSSPMDVSLVGSESRAAYPGTSSRTTYRGLAPAWRPARVVGACARLLPASPSLTRPREVGKEFDAFACRQTGWTGRTDGEAIARTLSRIAHEVIERNEELESVALVGIHTRGVPLAQRLRRLIAERADVELDLGQLDITFHRDDVHVARTGAAPAAAARPRHEARLRARRPHRDPRRRRPLHGPHDPLRDRRAPRLRPARPASSSPCSPTAATASCRSAPTTSARTCRHPARTRPGAAARDRRDRQRRDRRRSRGGNQ